METFTPVHQDCTKENGYDICREKDGTFHLDSCDSHGGCVAASNIQYCPYCGEKLTNPTPHTEEKEV